MTVDRTAGAGASEPGAEQSAAKAALDGRYIMGILGCDLAADPIGRQSCIADVRDNAKRGLHCERPALILVAVEPGHEDEAGERIRAALDPNPPQAAQPEALAGEGRNPKIPSRGAGEGAL